MGREKSNQVNVRTEPNNFLQQAFCHSQESYLEVPQYNNWGPDYARLHPDDSGIAHPLP
jgi:hypothetical protein